MSDDGLSQDELLQLNRRIARRCAEVRSVSRRTQEDLARKGLGLTTIKKIEREGTAELRSFFRLADAPSFLDNRKSD